MMRHITRLLIALCALFVAMSCSTTDRISEEDPLYVGIKEIKVDDKKGTDAEETALLEMEGAVAYAPNNSFFGSSTLRTPFPVGLWIYNSMDADSIKGIKKWFYDTFSTVPRTISSASPATRAKVATNVLQNYGYFNGKVDYRLITSKKNPKKQKIAYDVHLGHASTYDSIAYAFPATPDSIIKSTAADSYLAKGDQFSVANLQSERSRLATQFRNNGFYYYRTDYIKYFADSINAPGKVKLLVAQDENTPAKANRQWRFGKINLFFREQSVSGQRRGSNQYDDTIHRPKFDVAYQGKKVPVRLPIVVRNFKFWTGYMYSEDRVQRTLEQLTNLNSFSTVQFSFTPADTTDTCTVLDVALNATMDKLVDTEIDFNFTQKSNNQLGPDASITLSKRNAFRNGEKMSLTLRGSYYWQFRNRSDRNINNIDSYDWGVDAKLDYPWIVFPYFLKRNFYRPTSTNFTVSFTRTNVAHYVRQNLMSFSVDYKFKTSDRVTHTFSPVRMEMVDVRYLSDELATISPNAYSRLKRSDVFVPAIQYTYSFDNSSDRNRRLFTNINFILKEAGNITSAVGAIFGHSFDKHNKKMFTKPYSQFVKAQLEIRNKYVLSPKSCVATRVFAGAIWAYGNTLTAPLSEMYYSGGAYSVRAFPARSLGPGHRYYEKAIDFYLNHAGDLRFEMNAEYRFPLFGNFYGAVFVDAGNVWMLRDEAHSYTSEQLAEMKCTREDLKNAYNGNVNAKDFLRELALGTGFGLRYDMEFLVLRVDLGIALHAPWYTSRSGYYNIPRFFKDGVGINLAVGYPF